MTDHGEQPVEARRAPTSVAEVGQSFADAWGATSVEADSYAAPFDPAAESASPAQAASEALVPAGIGATNAAAGAGQAVSVTVRRAPRTEISTSAPLDGDDPLTVEVRREGTPDQPGRPAERIVVTVSLNQATEQIAVTF